MAQSIPKSRDSFRTTVSRAITQADTGTTVEAVHLPAGAFVIPYGVSIQVVEEFAGGTPLLDVGDGTQTAGFVSQSDNTATATGTYTGDATHSTYSDNGRYYAAADTVDVIVSAALTNGTAYIVVRWWDLSTCDLAAA
jgi:hypothetical protein